MNGETIYTTTLGDLLTLIAALLSTPAVLLHPGEAGPRLISPLSPALLPASHPSASACPRSRAEGSVLHPAGAFFEIRPPLFSALAEPSPGSAPRPT
jgi:hypothetical protein